MTHRIIPDIVPFGRITFPSTEPPIPKTLFPNRLFINPRPLARNEALPVSHPLFQLHASRSGWRTEKMNMIGKNHITSHHPFIRLNPGVDDQAGGVIGGKYFFPSCRANRHEDNGGSVVHFAWWQVNGSSSFRKGRIRQHASDVDAIELPNQAKGTRRSASLR